MSLGALAQQAELTVAAQQEAVADVRAASGRLAARRGQVDALDTQLIMERKRAEERTAREKRLREELAACAAERSRQIRYCEALVGLHGAPRTTAGRKPA